MNGFNILIHDDGYGKICVAARWQYSRLRLDGLGLTYEDGAEIGPAIFHHEEVSASTVTLVVPPQHDEKAPNGQYVSTVRRGDLDAAIDVLRRQFGDVPVQNNLVADRVV